MRNDQHQTFYDNLARTIAHCQLAIDLRNFDFIDLDRVTAVRGVLAKKVEQGVLWDGVKKILAQALQLQLTYFTSEPPPGDEYAFGVAQARINALTQGVHDSFERVTKVHEFLVQVQKQFVALEKFQHDIKDKLGGFTLRGGTSLLTELNH